ncbi:hypothetical protein SAMN05192565_1148 [Methylobacterium gossipiicola]|uniref:Uncharacterized protein n=1 Tax=Methylobacterium gossipiicola TaxID=582675 RepID=A0A1I2V9R3_9HYPH|nr:hypothetical protein SAMN05192565_1148 [Methylobacterium gossipiicola]
MWGRLFSWASGRPPAASEKGSFIQANGQGVLKIRTLNAGTEANACTTTSNQKRGSKASAS